MSTNTSSNTGGVNHSASSSSSGEPAPTNVVQMSRMTSNGVKCFACSETGHRQSDCKKQGKKALFKDIDDCRKEDGYVGEELVFDGTDTGDEEILEGDIGPVLFVHRMCLTPHASRDE